ncbi:hypothetical protein MtrunA17_Chr4g0001541 [Medicago truncatula]|uniref:Uncharacterized protein n=1 Tax=Medicago truncatula TaxID=3880 RepID=A0A396I423_MEDTR|nr:hypothetical protein MtrunA17_Chr4g0001541 [Medicago truncatula]
MRPPYQRQISQPSSPVVSSSDLTTTTVVGYLKLITGTHATPTVVNTSDVDGHELQRGVVRKTLADRVIERFEEREKEKMMKEVRGDDGVGGDGGCGRWREERECCVGFLFLINKIKQIIK